MKIHRSFCAVVGAIAAIFLLHGIFGWSLCAVQTCSMEPAIPTYSMCLVSTHVSYDDVKVGDIIVYVREPDNMHIIHRVSEITPDGIVTKGDANQSDDGISVTPDNLYARYIGHIPYVAHFYNLIHSQYGIFMIAGLAILVYVLDILTAKKEDCTSD